MRGQNDIVRQLRDVLRDLDELKTAQFVGSNQIVAKPFEYADPYDLQFSITAPFQSVGSSVKAIKITVIPREFPPENMLISDIVPKLTYTNDDRVSNWDWVNNTRANLATSYFLAAIDNASNDQNTYILGIIAPTNTVMRLKTYITANARVEFTLEEMN